MLTRPDPSVSAAEIILGMQTFIVSDASKSAVHGTIHCMLLLGGFKKKLAFSHRHHAISAADPGHVEAGLRTLARSVAERLQQMHGENGSDAIILTNGIPSKHVEFWDLPADTRLEEQYVRFFQRNLREGLGLQDQNIGMRAA